MIPVIKGTKSSGEETWTFQYDCSATIKYGQKCPGWTRKGAHLLHGGYRVTFTDGVLVSELSPEWGLGFCQGGRGEREFHVDGRTFIVTVAGTGVADSAGWEIQLAWPKGCGWGPGKHKRGGLGSTKRFPGLWCWHTAPSLPALGSFVLCWYRHQRAAKERLSGLFDAFWRLVLVKFY